MCLILSLSPSVSTETPLKEGEDAASSSDSASDSASTLFDRWGHDLGPESRRVALKKFRYYGYNGYLSDRISLTRPILDLRPDGSVGWSICALFIDWSVRGDSFFNGMVNVTASRSLCLHPPGAETCHTHQIFLSLASSSSLSTRPCRCCCAPSTQPSRGLHRTCSKRSYWWTTTAAAVRIIKHHRNVTFVLCGKACPALLDLQPKTQSSFITASIHRGQSARGGMKRCIFHFDNSLCSSSWQ